MALVSTTTTDLLGASAAKDATTLTVTLSELGTAGNVTTPASLTIEGAILALLQKMNDDQSADAASVLTVSRSIPFFVTRGGDSVRGERFTVTLYATDGVGPLDPDLV